MGRGGMGGEGLIVQICNALIVQRISCTCNTCN